MIDDPAADVCAFPHADRRDQLRVAADEGAVFDHRLVLVLAVVVAGDRARADVHVGADRRVAQIRQVIGLRPGPSVVFFSSTKLPILAPSPTTVSGRRCANGPSCAPSATRAPAMTAEVLDGDVVADFRSR